MVIGLDKQPGLDLYFATESCLRDDSLQYPGPLARRSGEFRYRADCEQAVFAADSRTRILLLCEQQQHSYARYYPQAAARWQVLPPGASRDCCRPADAARRRERLRAELAAGPTELLLLFAAPDVGAGGLGRAIHALAAVTARRPDLDYRLLVTGPDRAGAQRRLAGRAGVKAAVQFLGQREDLPQLLLAADALVHPALDEPAGNVILEALVAGLPVIASANCGYAQHIAEAAAGVVLPQPYRDDALSDAMERVSDGYFRHQCQDRALVYASRKDLYSMYETAAALLPELVAPARAAAGRAGEVHRPPRA